MKPGYKILIAIGISIILYKYINYNSQEKELVNKKINNLITDIRREDYFAIQNLLSSKLAQSISIEDIKSFTKDLNLTRDSKFILTNYNKDKNIIKVNGNIVLKSKKLPLKIIYQENNGTLQILEQIIGSKVLKSKKYTFPLNTK